MRKIAWAFFFISKKIMANEIVSVSRAINKIPENEIIILYFALNTKC